MDAKKRLTVVALACAIAAPAEGLRQRAYKDPVGIPTICFGSTKGVKLGDVATVEQCKGMLTAEMLQAIDQVDRCVPGLPTQVLAAFADAVYNLGPTIACSPAASTAARHLRAGRLTEACNELPKWDKARMPGIGLVPLPGLTARRAAERDLCLQPSAPAGQITRASPSSAIYSVAYSVQAPPPAAWQVQASTITLTPDQAQACAAGGGCIVITAQTFHQALAQASQSGREACRGTT